MPTYVARCGQDQPNKSLLPDIERRKKERENGVGEGRENALKTLILPILT